MNWTKLTNYLDKNKYPKYRQKQIKQAYFKNLITSWDNVSVLPKQQRENLKKEFPWYSLIIDKQQTSQDLVKFRLKCLTDNYKIELVIIKHQDNRNTVCISSQIGCAIGCPFCATGSMGIARNLSTEEIYDQVLIAAAYLKKEDKNITNIVLMGMGEPMNNYDNVREAIFTLHDPDGFNLGWRNFSISTCGIIPGINKQAIDMPQVNLAISLHAANNTLRDSLVPINKQYPLEKLIETCHQYAQKTNRKIFFEYTLLKDINNSDSQAQELAKLLLINKLFHVNIIKYNYTGFVNPKTKQPFTAASQKEMEIFKDKLLKAGIPTTIRQSYGDDIDAACGQLAT